MLLNPSVQGDQKLEGLSADPFDRPIPGQSLTSTPKAWPWENPPEFTDVDEAFMYIIEKICFIKVTFNQLSHLLCF